MATQLSNAAANAAADGIVDLVDGGSGELNGKLELWSGAMPVSTLGTPAGDLLAEIDYEDPAFGAASSGVATALGAPLTGVGLPAASTGTDIGFYRVVNKSGTTIWQNDAVSTAGSTGLVLNTINVSDGVTVEITSHTFTQPTT